MISRLMLPLSKEEQTLVLATAKGMKYKGHDVYADTIFFIDTGIHPCVLAKSGEKKYDLRVTIDDGEKHLYWNRPKKKGTAAFTNLIMPRRLEPLIDLVLKQRAKYRQFYNSEMKKISRIVRKRYNRDIKISPLRLRHTFGVNRLNDGLATTTIQQLMNCSEKTLRFYLKFSKKMLDEQVKQHRW